ncbi:hypothetical protein BGZ58_004864, partial [Dissophora ornata]
ASFSRKETAWITLHPAYLALQRGMNDTGPRESKGFSQMQDKTKTHQSELSSIGTTAELADQYDTWNTLFLIEDGNQDEGQGGEEVDEVVESGRVKEEEEED